MERNKEKKESETFKIRVYGRTELAYKYCPRIKTRQGAFRTLNRWIDKYPGLREKLDSMSVSKNSRVYTPAQVRVIVEAFGEP